MSSSHSNLMHRAIVSRTVVVVFFMALAFILYRMLSKEKRPHIVFMLADDLGYHDLGYARRRDGSALSTPFLDELAAHGLKLRHSYTQQICSASRAALLTGRYPFRYGFQRTASANDEIIGLPRHRQILPEKLRELGYQTHLIGKWHLGHCRKEHTPLYRGFDTFRGFLSGSEGYYTHKIRHKYYDYWQNSEIFRSDKYSTTDFAEYTANLIMENSDSKPMFLYLAMQSPHMPYDAPPGVPENATEEYKYLKMVETLDEFTRTIYQALHDKGIMDNTIFIFSSDNGATPHAGSNWPHRGYKQDLFEGGTRVRSFISGPNIPQGVYTGLFHATDWYPTILNMAGNRLQDIRLDGVDQFDALLRNQEKFDLQPRKDFIYDINEKASKNGSINSAAVRLRFLDEYGEMRDFKFMTGLPGPSEPELDFGQQGVVFDLVSDPLERRPLQQGFTAEREMMRDMIRHQKAQGYKRHETRRSEAAFQMTDDDLQPIMGPGWC